MKYARLFLHCFFATLLFFSLAQACELINPQTITTGSNSTVVDFAYPGNCLAALNEVTPPATSDISMVNISTSNVAAKVAGPNAAGNFDTPFVPASDMAFSPLGTALAVIGVTTEASYNGGIAIYRRDPTTCSLTLVPGPGTGGTYSIDGSPTALAFSCNGQFIVTVNSTNLPTLDNTISVFQIDCNTLTLTKVGPDIVTNLVSLSDIAFLPTCTGLVILDSGSCSLPPTTASKATGQLSIYDFDSQTGTLTHVPGPNLNGYYDTNIFSSLQLAVPFFSPFLAVANGGAPVGDCELLVTPGGITMYDVSTNNTLTQIVGPNSNESFGEPFPIYIAFSPNTTCLTTSNVTKGYLSFYLSQYAVPSTGELMEIDTLDSSASAIGGIAYSQDLRNFAVANSDTGTVTLFQSATVSPLGLFIRAKYCVPPGSPCI